MWTQVAWLCAKVAKATLSISNPWFPQASLQHHIWHSFVPSSQLQTHQESFRSFVPDVDFLRLWFFHHFNLIFVPPSWASWFLLCFEKWNMIRSLHRCFILKMYQILYAVPVWLPVWFDLCSLMQLASEINYSRILRRVERRAASETRHVMTGGIPSRMVAISSGGIINHFILDTLAMLTISCSSYSFMFNKFNTTLILTLLLL